MPSCAQGLRGLPLLIALGPSVNILGPLAVALWRLRGGLRHDLALAAATATRNAFVAASHLLPLPHPQTFEVADVVMQEALTGLHNCVTVPIMEQVQARARREGGVWPGRLLAWGSRDVFRGPVVQAADGVLGRGTPCLLGPPTTARSP